MFTCLENLNVLNELSFDTFVDTADTSMKFINVFPSKI